MVYDPHSIAWGHLLINGKIVFTQSVLFWNKNTAVFGLGQREKMINALKKNVVPGLLDAGFKGKYPHYKRKHPNRIELLVFQQNNRGNSFIVEISTIFPGERDKESKNYYTTADESADEINVWSTLNRFRLKGMLDGWFYYTDVYRSPLDDTYYYHAVSEMKAAAYTPGEDEVLVQKASEGLYAVIAGEVNQQMKAAYEWWAKNAKPKKKNPLAFLSNALHIK